MIEDNPLYQQFTGKQQAEASFWQYEVNRYIQWYKNEVPSLYYTPCPEEYEKVRKPSVQDAAILTWTEMHQKPKYKRELAFPADALNGMKVLDVGSGPIPSAVCFSGCDLYALDPLHPLYRALGFPHHLYPEVHFVDAPAESIPFVDHYFDAIISVNAIDHVDDLEVASRELQRVMCEDGLFRMQVNYHPATVFEPIEINDTLFSDLFGWVKGLHVLKRAQRSFSFQVTGEEEFVLWGN